jgi:hypothetical protein
MPDPYSNKMRFPRLVPANVSCGYDSLRLVEFFALKMLFMICALVSELQEHTCKGCVETRSLAPDRTARTVN